MQRRIEIDCALSSMMPKAAPDAPLGARARQWYADIDSDWPRLVALSGLAAVRRPLI
jgi:hypothetical protein